MHGIDKTLSQHTEVFAIFTGALNNLVIDIGHIAHISQLVTRIAKISGDDIKNHHDAGMADMAIIIDRHPANIHADFARYTRLERFFLTRECVIYFQH